MKSPPANEPLVRLRDDDASDPRTSRARELLRNVGAPAPLTRAQLSSVVGRLNESRRPSRWRRPFEWSFAGAAVATLIALLWLRFTPSAPRTGRDLVVPEGLTATLHGAHGETVLVYGPAHAVIAEGGDEVLVLEDGQVAMRAAATPATLRAGGQRVTIEAGGLVEAVVRQRSIRFAAYEGGARVRLQEIDRTLELPAGSALDDGKLRTLEPGLPTHLASLARAPVAIAPTAVHETAVAPPLVEAAAPKTHRERKVGRPAKQEELIATADPAPTPSPMSPSPLPSPSPSPSPSLSPSPNPSLSPNPSPSPSPNPSLSPSPNPSSAAPKASAAPAPVESSLATETRLLSSALKQLRGGDARGALRALDDYEKRFASGRLGPESRRARVEALLALDKRKPALEVLDRMDGDLGTGELRLVRGELRAELHRERAAIEDFDAALSHLAGPSAERALYGRASARARLHDDAGARADLEDYLRRYPAGQFVAAARRALER